MAPSRSSNYTLIVLLVAFAVVTPNLLHQCTAARDGGGAAKTAAAPAPAANGEVVLHPTASYEIPDLPLPRILPCPPLFPKIPFIPCYKVTPPAPPPPPARPKECRTALMRSLVPPCSGFLTNNGSACESSDAPSSECCDGVHGFFGGDKTVYDPLCLCYVMNGDVSQLLPAPVNHTRALALVQVCLYGLNPQPFSDICNNDQTIRDQMPPMDIPEPPPPALGNMA